MDPHQLHFLILEKDCFIAHDMADGLRIAGGEGCDSQPFRQVDDLLDYLLTLASPDLHPVVVTKLSLEQIDETGISSAALGCAADVVVRLGTDLPDAILARGWFTLAAPFTSDDLSALVSMLRLSRQPLLNASGM